MEQGWVKLHRKMLNWEWFDEPTILHLFLFLLLNANFETKKWQGKIIERGSFVTSLDNISVATKMSIKQVRTRLKKLQLTGDIEVKGANKNTLITICNYDSYQSRNIDEGQTKGKQRANKGQTKGKQRANKGQQLKNVKNIKNVKNERTLILENEKKSDFEILESRTNPDRTKNVQKIENFNQEILELTEFCKKKGYKSEIATSTATKRAFRKLLERGEQKENIKAAIDFAVNDIEFWGSIFTSPAMLLNEDKADSSVLLYDKLILKALTKNNQNGNKRGITASGVAEIMRKHGLVND